MMTLGRVGEVMLEVDDGGDDEYDHAECVCSAAVTVFMTRVMLMMVRRVVVLLVRRRSAGDEGGINRLSFLFFWGGVGGRGKIPFSKSHPDNFSDMYRPDSGLVTDSAADDQ